MSVAPSFDELKNAIDQHSFFELPLNLPREDIDAYVDAFFAFLTLPEVERQQFAFDIKQDDKDRGLDLGYRRKGVGGEANYDNKEFFHYNDYALEGFSEQAGRCPEGQALIVSAEKIYRPVLAAAHDMIRILDTQYPGLYDRFFPAGVHPGCMLRILKYDRSRNGDFLAKGHYDRSSCAIAIAESAPGLRIGTDEHRLTPVAHKPGVGLFFPGMSMAGHTNGDFLPSWHDVVQSGPAYNEETSRWAIVFFINPPDPNYFDTHTLHTPISPAKN